MKITKKEQKYIKSRIRCGCTHYARDHYNHEGWCDKCGCTWYWPNDTFIKRWKKMAKDERMERINK